MSIERVLEPEYMDTPEEARDYDSMDHRTVNQLFVDDFATAGEVSGDILDLGTGTAQIPVMLCEQHSDCRVMAADMAVNMLDLARYNIEVASLTQRIELRQIDAKGTGLPDDTFDATISNSIIHHIPEPLNCLKEAVRVTKSGGRLFFRDLMRPESREELDRLVDLHAGEDNEHQRKMFAESLHAALTVDEFRDMIESLGFERDGVQATSDRHWTWNAVKP